AVGRILRREDEGAAAMLLAAARLGRVPLPLEAVGKLMNGPAGTVATAAERYLLADDGAEARKLVLAKHKGEILVLGGRMSYDPGHYSYQTLDKGIETLRVRMRATGGPDEIFALTGTGYWGGPGGLTIEVKGTEATLILRAAPGRTRQRKLSAAELAGLK